MAIIWINRRWFHLVCVSKWDRWYQNLIKASDHEEEIVMKWVPVSLWESIKSVWFDVRLVSIEWNLHFVHFRDETGFKYNYIRISSKTCIQLWQRNDVIRGEMTNTCRWSYRCCKKCWIPNRQIGICFCYVILGGRNVFIIEGQW